MNTSIYQNIATRTAGDIYIGVVGPVRTGKSTFIKRFLETQVIPNIENVYRRERARDELPQSGSGRTIMTAEPKFVPEEAAQIQLEGGGAFSVRLIDCVGYMVRGAIGQFEDDAPRMVTTPWYDHEIPMTEAAEIGTRKVISEHSTIGIVITTDGSIADIPREDYLEAEERVIRELRELGKPFVVLLNSADPRSDRCAVGAALGKAGDQLWRYANGLDKEPVASFYAPREIKSVGNSMTFRQDLRNMQEIRAGIALLSDSVAARLRADGLKCRTIQVQIKDPNFKVIQRQRTLPRPTYLQRELVQTSLELIEEHWNPNAPIRLLSVTGTDLVPADETTEQVSFFAQPDEAAHEKLERLEDAMASIRKKFGKDVIGYGKREQK